jgi:pyocin large subunit-like protein
MSFEAMAWANKQKCSGPTSKLILILIANLSDENYESYPSHSYLANCAECDDRTIKRALDDLAKLNLITITPRFLNGKQTSNLYTLQIRGDKNEGVGVSNMYPDTIRDNKDILSTPKKKNEYTVEFEEFWKAYPRNDGKYAAYKKWTSIIKNNEIDYKIIIDAAKKYATSRIGQDATYTALAETWLNKKRWLDINVNAAPKATNRNSLAG